MGRQVRRHADYAEDFYAWANEQAGLLRDRKTSDADLDNIAEELEGLSRSERRALLSSLRLIVLHLLKLQHQPERATHSWRNTIHRERLNVDEALADMPSLRSQMAALFDKAYRDGRRLAIAETGLSPDLFPEVPELTIAQIGDARYLPNAHVYDDSLSTEQDPSAGASHLLLRALRDRDET